MSERDIVARLRESDGGYFMRQMFTEAADEIERLREALRIEQEELAACCIDRRETQRERDEARRERDEARWRLCKVVGDNRGVWGCEIAKENGWDYLATEAKP